MILMMLKKQKLRSALKKGSKNERMWQKKINFLKKQQKIEENKVKKKEMWERLSELNGEFKNIKKAAKEAKKMSGTIIN